MSAQAQSLTITIREGTGSNSAKRVRDEGLVPGIFYGPGTAPVKVATPPKDLLTAIKTDRKENTLLQLKTAKGGTPVDGKYVLLKDYQRDPISRDLVHVDFLEVALDREVKVEVPIRTTGKCAGVTEGGVLTLLMHKISLWALPDRIPAFYEVDVTDLRIGKSLHTTGVKFPEGVRPAYNTARTIAAVVAPEEEEKLTEAQAAEAAAAAGAAAASAAAGGAPGAPGAAAPAAGAAAPAAGGKPGDAKAAAPAAKAGGDKKK